METTTETTTNKQNNRGWYWKKRYQEKKQEYHLLYLKKKTEREKKEKENRGNYYEANHIKVFISFKDYLNNSSEKIKLWKDFNAVYEQLRGGVSSIIEIMRLREVAENLISDYWKTGKEKIRLDRQWSSLTREEQLTKIKAWEKAREREEQELLNSLEDQERHMKEKRKEKVLRKQNEQVLEDYKDKKDKECLNCGDTVKRLNQETGTCKKCSDYEL